MRYKNELVDYLHWLYTPKLKIREFIEFLESVLQLESQHNVENYYDHCTKKINYYDYSKKIMRKKLVQSNITSLKMMMPVMDIKYFIYSIEMIIRDKEE